MYKLVLSKKMGSFKILFSCHSFLFSSFSTQIFGMSHLISKILFMFLQSLFPLFFRLNNLYGSVIKFTAMFCHLDLLLSIQQISYQQISYFSIVVSNCIMPIGIFIFLVSKIPSVSASMRAFPLSA